jgi:hypothetical protein
MGRKEKKEEQDDVFVYTKRPFQLKDQDGSSSSDDDLELELKRKAQYVPPLHALCRALE